MEHNNNTTGIDSNIASIKQYVPIATLSTNDSIKSLENLNLGLK